MANGFDEAWLAAYQAKQRKPDALQRTIEAHGFKDGHVPKKKAAPGKWQGGNLRLILPFKLPTWNRILAMNPWERKRVRDFIKEQVCTCIQSASALPTPTGYVLRVSSTPSSLQEYYRTITPPSSKKSATRKKRAT